MNVDTNNRQDHGYLAGLLTGTIVGAGLALWFAPRVAAEIRQRITDTARGLGDRAAERYQQASTRVTEAVDDLKAKGQNVRDDMADAVVRGADGVARQAAALKTDRAADTRRHTAADRSSATHSL